MPRDPLPSPEDRRPMARLRPAPRRRAAWLAVSALLHVAAIALLLLSPRPALEDGDAQPSYDVVFADPTTDQPAPPDAGTDTPAPPVPPDPDAQPAARPPTPPPDDTPPEPVPPEPAPPESEPPPPEPAPPEPAPPEPAPPEPVPAPPRPRPPPSVRLMESDVPEPLPLPPPVPIPAAPPPPPRPAAPPRPQQQQQAQRFPAPIDLNFGPANPGRPARGSVASRAIDLSLGPAKPGSLRAASSELRSPNASADLMAALEAWWRRHRYYPEQARQAGEDGSVGIRLRVDRYGKVAAVEMQSRSGSQWLDMAALGAFRGAQLVVPSNAGETVSVDLTIHYILILR